MKKITLGEYIRLNRKERLKMPRLELSKRLGISLAKLQRIEQNQIQITPEPKLLEKISHELGTPYDVLVDLIYQYKDHAKEEKTARHDIPIVPWDMLPNIQNLSIEMVSTGSIPVMTSYSDDAVAVECKTAQWQPFVNLGDILVLLLNTTPDPSDIVLCMSGTELTLSKISKIDNKLAHFPAFPAYEKSEIFIENNDLHVLGILEQRVTRFKN